MTIRDNQSRILTEILAGNKNTDYGRRYEFDRITTTERFRSALPVVGYDDYAPLIALMMRLGERNIFTADKIVCYMLSFGSDGSGRFIPCTDKYIELYSKVAARGALGRMLVPGHIFLLNASFPKLRRFNDGLYLNSISGTLLAKYTERIFGKSKRGSVFTSPKELIYPKGMFDHRYARVLFALADEDVRLIVAPYAELIADSFAFLKANREMLADDVEAGLVGRHDNLPKEFWIPEDIRGRLTGMLKPNPERARKLRVIFKEGFEQPVAHRIWPQLAYIITQTEGITEEITNQLKPYTGNIPVCNGPYFTAEALIGGSIVGSPDEYSLLPEAGFFEFAPIQGGIANAAQTLLADELGIGKEYAVIVTNCLGLYRYSIGDVIRVLRMENGVPIIKIVHRSGVEAIFSNSSDKENIFRTVERELSITSARA
jgi:hypothetical protein